jgi:hypothetical protein
MKLLITAEQTIKLEVQPLEGQQVAFTDIVGILEYAKQLVIEQWKNELIKLENEQQEQQE